VIHVALVGNWREYWQPSKQWMWHAAKRVLIEAADRMRPRCGCRLSKGPPLFAYVIAKRARKVTYAVECSRCGAAWVWGKP